MADIAGVMKSNQAEGEESGRGEGLRIQDWEGLVWFTEFIREKISSRYGVGHALWRCYAYSALASILSLQP